MVKYYEMVASEWLQKIGNQATKMKKIAKCAI